MEDPLQYESNKNGIWMMREKLTALSDITTEEIATGLMGILNNPHWVYEKGEREVRIDTQKEIIPAGSGKILASTTAKQIEIDHTLLIQSQNPLSIRYTGATKPERARFTDELSLNFIGQEKTWRAGETISVFEANLNIQ